MATTRSTGKIAPQGVRQPRASVRQVLHATDVPPVERPGQRGQTVDSPEWLIRLIGVLALKGQEQTDLGMQRMTCRFWNALGGQQVRRPPSSDRPVRERFKTIGDQLGAAPGSVVHLGSQEALDARRQWRQEAAQSVGTGLAHQAERAREHPRRVAWHRPGGDGEPTCQ